MALFTLHLDLAEIVDLEGKFDAAVKTALKDAARDLSAQIHARIIENVQTKLHSSREKYLQNLSIHPDGENTWVVELGKDALFIEDGMPRHSMIADLLASPKAKTAKDGSRYLVVPFEHKEGKGPTNQTPPAKDLTDAIKAEFQKRKISWGKIEKKADGTPKLGLLHSFKMDGFAVATPDKTREGAGMGHGPIGSPRQGPTGIPFLQGVQVRQMETKNRNGGSSVKKFVTTFRVVSSKMMGTERWTHPGLEARNFMDEAFEWASRTWESEISPRISAQIVGSL